ncbi:MAG: HNH endonuclease [Candidatus Aenigmatarchaeota archaeon]|nr:MAG: HNH endonuclease [Candidatus Aenigmarchaeota archaeon]
MKLEIELIPSTAWYSNLRNKILKKEWDAIRKQSYADADYKCAICGAEGRLNCHELWEYDDQKHIQKLKGFIALCGDCHMIKHLGFAEIRCSKGLLDMDKLIKHFMKVNNVDKNTFDKCHEYAFKIWGKRSQKEWITDLAQWSNFINNSKS